MKKSERMQSLLSVTFPWMSLLSDRKVPIYSLDIFKKYVCLSVGYRLEQRKKVSDSPGLKWILLSG